ncbi:hypothetical protein KR032_004983 [Drosophila birchii]|nr:hypothetical protein KR032_004983 [Drosophila birchii]
MDHRLSSEAFNQNYSSQESCVSDVPPQAARVRRQRPSEPCPCSQPANPERIFVLRNCDLSPDYVLSPCQESQCPRCGTNCSGPGSCPRCGTNCTGPGSFPSHSTNSTGSCPSHSTNSSGSCPSHSTNSSAEYPGQEPLCGEKVKPKKPPKPAPGEKQQAKRHTGGTNDICPLCGQVGDLKSDQHMCAQCNERIHTAVNNYLQCQYEAKEQAVNSYNQTGQPANGQNGQWQETKFATGDPNFNVIVLQDCQTKQELFDQLSMAMNRNAGQNSNTTNYQNSNTNNYQNSNTNNYQNNYPNNYKNNTAASYNDYDYVDYNRNYQEHPEPYDCRCDVNPCQVRPPCCYSEGGYDDYRCSCRTPCSSSFDSAPREGQCFCQDESLDDFLDQNSDPGCGCTCTCNCEYCRKGFESKEKLAMLIAQALEIFIQGYQERRNSPPKPIKKKSKKKNHKERTSAGSSEAPPEVGPPLWQAKPPRPRRAPESRSTDRSYGPRKRSPRPPPQIHVLTAVHEPITQSKAEKQAPKMSNSKVNAKSNSQVNLQRFGSKEKASRETVVPSESTNAEGSPGNCNSPIFFLPNSGDELRSAHDFGSAAWARSCAKCGGGDSRRRRRARRRNRYHQNRHHHPEWNQSQNREGEDRRWQKELCNAANQIKSSGGGKNTAVLLGLSPIAHYRPGMMKFPVNYLLAGTNYRRSLVRTAAGVTLHQKPYMDKDEVKDLPSFPCNKESSHLDCRMPPTKKWL